MKVIIKYNDSFLNLIWWFGSIGGITLFPFIILREKYNKKWAKSHITPKIINHESIHVEQQKELLVIFFYLLYLSEWFVRLFMKGNAYRNISFEREAYANQGDMNYLKNRKLFGFLRYM